MTEGPEAWAPLDTSAPRGWAVPDVLESLARGIAEVGGRALVVGGAVRDRLLGRPGHDLDLEVFGLDEATLGDALGEFGLVGPVGRQFATWRDARSGLDVALPRGSHEASGASLDAAFREASRHRDLTVDAIGWDPLEGRLLDPWRGIRDLEQRRLRAVDRTTFGADPLRVLRVARLAASLEAEVDPVLERLCATIDLAALPVERVAGELLRMLVGPRAPSRAFRVLSRMGQLEVFAPLPPLRGVPQDPEWHPEGDVWTHTLLCLDRAAELGRGLVPEERTVLLLAVLCHDLGKPATTRVEGGRIRSLGHEGESARRTTEWLEALRLSERRIRAVTALVAHHLAPVLLVAQDAGPRAYRRLARRLAEADVSIVSLERVARADHWGRTTPDAADRRFVAGDRFLAAAEAASVRQGIGRDVVSARALMRRGVAAGPELGRLLARCREIQDETGWADPERIIVRALRESSADDGAADGSRAPCGSGPTDEPADA